MESIKGCLSLLEGLGTILSTVAKLGEEYPGEYTNEENNIKNKEEIKYDSNNINNSNTTNITTNNIDSIHIGAINFGDININMTINGGACHKSSSSYSDDYWIDRDKDYRDANRRFYKVNG